MKKPTPLTEAVRVAIQAQAVPQLRDASEDALARVGLYATKLKAYDRYIPQSDCLLAALIELGIELEVDNPSAQPGDPKAWRITAQAVEVDDRGESETGSGKGPVQVSLLATLGGVDFKESRVVRKSPGVVEIQLELSTGKRAS